MIDINAAIFKNVVPPACQGPFVAQLKLTIQYIVYSTLQYIMKENTIMPRR